MTLTLNAVTQFFQQDTWLMMLYYQTKFGCKQTSSLEDTVQIVIFWLYKPSLWPWRWIRWTNFSAWNSDSWCCITIPSLVSKWSAVQKISSDKYSLTFGTFAVTLTLNAVTHIVFRPHWLMMLYYQIKFGCKQTSTLEDRVEIVIFWLCKPLLWPWHWRRQTNFSARHSGSCCCITIPTLVSK